MSTERKASILLKLPEVTRWNGEVADQDVSPLSSWAGQ